MELGSRVMIGSVLYSSTLKTSDCCFVRDFFAKRKCPNCFPYILYAILFTLSRI